MFIRKENSYFPSYTVDRHPLNNDNVIFVGKHLEFSPVFLTINQGVVNHGIL